MHPYIPGSQSGEDLHSYHDLDFGAMVNRGESDRSGVFHHAERKEVKEAEAEWTPARLRHLTWAWKNVMLMEG